MSTLHSKRRTLNHSVSEILNYYKRTIQFADAIGKKNGSIERDYLINSTSVQNILQSSQRPFSNLTGLEKERKQLIEFATKCLFEKARLDEEQLKFSIAEETYKLYLDRYLKIQGWGNGYMNEFYEVSLEIARMQFNQKKYSEVIETLNAQMPWILSDWIEERSNKVQWMYIKSVKSTFNSNDIKKELNKIKQSNSFNTALFGAIINLEFEEFKNSLILTELAKS